MVSFLFEFEDFSTLSLPHILPSSLCGFWLLFVDLDFSILFWSFEVNIIFFVDKN